ncbi:peptide chain release factor N(5)-glutamine methyltransferase [Tissierella carlieri]|jgi:release factor glutamine methyltransferase|uniref:peptide chain release factor N(5)-glutamine methyltransferase n=1 Tax=Tissierella TaxID=41273 RepID=UPI000BA17B97|nr:MULTISPECIES: peptide chain release factor N(5)-glutamine methyltransferase [Tissierella]MBU5310699.1 peptide chain release factor N(5)-glutamine methyltransferase [Tissierella carlieri]OZV13395.1 protein-(glutamine-N5) methyltransferase, release factor-specific [Tissierella sp. P1]
MVTINNLLRKSENSILDSILILCKLLDVDKSYIYTYGDREVSKEVEEKFLYLMEERARGYPIQYILGEREFMGLDFYLEEGVLVPRPDTEILVEYTIDYINKNYGDRNIKVLDLGIGSGAISLSIAHYCKNAFVYGVDISDTAIKVANINKEKLNLFNVNFYKGDLFKALEGLDLDGGFQIIASNPPYIASKEIENLDTTVKDFEPRLALDGGLDGLDFYRKITPESKQFLDDNGLLIYEIGYDQGEAVVEILHSEGFNKVSVLKDLQGLDRVVLGIK